MKVIYYVATSLDGYVAEEDGDVFTIGQIVHSVDAGDIA
jgi:hypothetical protein